MGMNKGLAKSFHGTFDEINAKGDGEEKGVSKL